MTRCPRRPTLRALGLLLVLLLATAATGCGGSGGAQDDAAFCEAWTTLEGMDQGSDPRAGFDQVIELVETLRDTAPDTVATAAQQALDTLVELEELADQYDWDLARLRASPDGDRFAEIGQDMAKINATGPLADHAHQVCGAADPRFKLGCVASGLESIPMDSDPVTPVVTDPDQLAEERLATLDAGTTTARRDLDGGGYEYAFIEASGETTSVIEVGQDDRGGWVVTDVRACR